VKSTKDEKEVAEIYGINPKTLHRWIEKVPKKNQGKYNYL
jgi:transposase-like protein